MNRSWIQRTVLVTLTVAAVTACEAFRDAFGGSKDVVAVAAGHRLTIEDAGRMLAAAPAEIVPATPEIAGRIASLWVDYMLLATEIASADSVADLPLDRILERELNQELLWQLRETEILPRVSITDEDLRAAYDSAQPGVRFRAAHILIRLPTEPETQDSARRLAESLRARAAAGADFAALARRHSADPGSAREGGDLGWFERGRMVPEFESAVEALEPGQVSPVVTTRFGLHIIKLLERERPSFEEVAATFRNDFQSRQAEAFEQAYIDSLVEAANVEIQDGAVETAREIARAGAGAELSRAHARETLVRYRGGSFTAKEFYTFLTTTPPQTASYFGQGNDEQVQFGLRRLAQDELLVHAARDRGLTVDSVIADSLRTLALRRVLSVARSAGLRRDALAGSDTLLDRAVRDLLTGALQGQRRIGTLGVVGLALREKHPARVYDERLPQVAQRAEQLRTGTDTVPPPTGPADSVPATPGESADTAPGGA